MDDFSLDDLMAELDAVQAEETKHKLSERNCVEILQTLMKSGLLRGLMYTLDGKEYLTPEQLKREISYELTAAGGRISLGAIEAALNLDSSYIESKTKELIEEDSLLQLISNGSELISEQYVNDLIDEIIEHLLEGEGHVTVGDLATNYGLSVKFMSKALEKRKNAISNMVHMKHGVLYTNGFVDRHKGRVLGALNAITRPTSIQKLVQFHGFIDNEMVEEVIKAAIANKTLNGTLRGNEFIPDIFGRMQHLACESFFESNGYLPKERARKVRIKDAAKFLRQKYPNLINLNSYVIDESMYDRLEAVVMEEVISGKKWISISKVFEDIPFDEKDIEALGKLCNEKMDQCIPIGFDFLISNDYLKKCRTTLSAGAKQIAAAEANAVGLKETVGMNNGNTNNGVSDNTYNDNSSESKKKSGKKKKGKRGQQHDDEGEGDGDDNDLSKRSNKRKGKGKKGKKGKRGNRKGDYDDEDDSYETKKTSKKDKGGTNRSERKKWRVNDIEKLLLKHDSSLKNEIGDLEDNSKNLLNALGIHLYEFGKSEYEKAYSESIAQLSKSGASNTRDILNALEKIFHIQYANLQHYAKSCVGYRKLVDDILLQMAQEDEEVEDSDRGGEDGDGNHKNFEERSKEVAKHIAGLKKMCIDSCSKKILAIVLGMEASKVGIDLLQGRDCNAQNPKDKANAIVELLTDLALCRQYIDTSQLSVSKDTMIKLFEATKNGPDELLELLPAIATECDLLIKKTDKKVLKQTLFSKRKEMLGFFENTLKSDANDELVFVMSKSESLSTMAKLVLLANGILLPSDDVGSSNYNNNNNINKSFAVTPFSLLMTPSVGKILPPILHKWLSEVSNNNSETVTEKEADILRQIAVTKKLANIDEALFQ